MKTPHKASQGIRGLGAYQLVLGVFLTGLMVSGGCSQHDADPSDLRHNINEPVNHTAGYLWQELTPQVFKQVVVPIMRMWTDGEAEYLEDDHELVIKSQQWIDKIHNELTKRYPQEMAEIPRPIAKVLLDPTPNAFVMPIPVCYSLPVVWGNPKNVFDVDENDDDIFAGLLKQVGVRSQTADDVWLSPDGIVMRAWNRGHCVPREVNGELEKFAAWFSDHSGGCKMTLKDGAKFGLEAPQVAHLEGECQLDRSLAGTTYARRLVVGATGGMVTFHSGLATIMDEEEFISVAAHELGHYYRGHVILNEKLDYEFFYKIGRRNDDKKPAADSSLQSFGEELKSLEFNTRYYRQVKEQKFRSEVFMPAIVAAASIAGTQDCEAGACNETCAKLGELIQSDEFQDQIGRFPIAVLSGDGIETYHRFEREFAECAGAVKVTEEGSDDGSALSLALMKRSLQADSNLAPMLRGTPMKDTVLETIVAAQETLAEAEAKAAAPLKKAHEMKLGYYTVEQEADEISIEWMSYVGLDPKHAIEAELVLGEFIEEMYGQAGIRPYPMTVGAQECRDLYENSWEREGDYQHIPIGDFADNHHSSCFRAFNLHREVEAHQFRVSDQVAFAGLSSNVGTWESIKADLNERHGGVEHVGAFLRSTAIDRTLQRADFKHSQHPLERQLHRCRFYGNL